MKITFQQPGRDEPGYLRRADAFFQINQRLGKLKEGGNVLDDPTIFRDIVEFLLPYVHEPADRAAARNALLDASENELSEIWEAFGAAMKGGAVPPASGGSSSTGSGTTPSSTKRRRKHPSKRSSSSPQAETP